MQSTKWQGKRKRDRNVSCRSNPSQVDQQRDRTREWHKERTRKVWLCEFHLRFNSIHLKDLTNEKVFENCENHQGDVISGYSSEYSRPEPGPSSGSWLRSTSPAEVLMLLGLKWAGRGPSYQKWVLPRGTATDPCYWLWQSRHSGCLWAFHTHVGGTATHPNLTQLELILMRGDDG